MELMARLFCTGDTKNYGTRAAAEEACTNYGSSCGGITSGGATHWEVRAGTTPTSGNAHETSYVIASTNSNVFRVGIFLILFRLTSRAEGPPLPGTPSPQPYPLCQDKRSRGPPFWGSN